MTRRHRTTLICLVLILLSVIVFAEVRNHQFVFDDLGFIIHNSMVKDGLTWNGFTWAFTTWHTAHWHPLTWLSHMLDCQIFGLNAAGPHLTSLFFHIVNSVLLFLLLQFCTGEVWPSFLVAALFAVHPLHVESVAWVAERKDVLSAFFWLLAMWAYIGYVRHPGWKSYLLIILCFCLGLMAKEMLVTLPMVFLLWDYWPLHRWVPTGMKVAGKDKIAPGRKCPSQSVSWRRLGWEKVPLLVLAVISSLGAFYSQKTEALVVSLADLPFSARINNALVSYVSYMGKTVWPMHLAVYYPHPGNTLPLWESLGAALVLVVLSCAIFRKALKYPYLLVGWLWFLGTLVPVIGLVQVGGQSMADRYTYIPLIGLFIMLAWGLPDLLAKWRCPKLLMPMISGSMILICATCAWFQVRVWRDAVSLFERAVNETSDNALAQINLGVALYFRGEVDRALKHFQEARCLNSPDSLNGLAWVMATTGNPKFLNGAKAVELATTANELTQYKQPAYLDTLAAAYAAAGSFSEAIKAARQALELARHTGKIDLARDIQTRLSLYQQGRAYQDEAYTTFLN